MVGEPAYNSVNRSEVPRNQFNHRRARLAHRNRKMASKETGWG